MRHGNDRRRGQGKSIAEATTKKKQNLCLLENRERTTLVVVKDYYAMRLLLVLKINVEHESARSTPYSSLFLCASFFAWQILGAIFFPMARVWPIAFGMERTCKNL